MKARGVDVKTNKAVEGYHCEIRGKHYIILNSAKIFVHHYLPTSNPLDGEGISGFVEIYPLSLALDTGVQDKKGKAIFGSYPVDGVMSRGGDRIRYYTGQVSYPPPQGKRVYGKGAVIFENGMFQLGGWLLFGSGHLQDPEIIGFSQWEAKQ